MRIKIAHSCEWFRFSQVCELIIFIRRFLSLSFAGIKALVRVRVRTSNTNACDWRVRHPREISSILGLGRASCHRVRLSSVLDFVQAFCVCELVLADERVKNYDRFYNHREPYML